MVALNVGLRVAAFAGRDLWLAIGKQAGEDVDGAMASFLDQPGTPV